MQINVTGRHLSITDSIEQFIHDKFEKIERHFDKISSVNVVIEIDSGQHKAEATLNVPGNDLFASATASDMYPAIEQMCDKLDRQIIKHKEKSVDRKHNH